MSEKKEDAQIYHHPSIPTVKISDENSLSLSDEDLTDLRIQEDEAARKIQNYYRSKKGLESENDLEDNSGYQYSDEEYLAALTIQNHYRNYYELKQTKIKQEDAAKIIQHHYRNHLRKSEEEFKESLENAARMAHKNYNDSLNVGYQNNDDDQLNETAQNTSYVRKDLDRAACVIQKHYRTHLQERQKKEHDIIEDKAARMIQRHYKIHANKQNYAKPTQSEVGELYSDRETAAAVKIQREYRNHLKQNQAASKIQRHYRAHLVKKPPDELEDLRQSEAAITIQRKYRNHLKQNEAALTIQKHYKLHLNRRDVYQHENCSAGALGEGITEEPIPAEDSAALVIQKRYKKRYQARQDAATCIQGHFRNHLNHKKQEDKAARKIQGHYRKFKHEKDGRELEKLEAEKAVKAATLIQKQYRAHLTQQAQKRSESKVISNVINPTMNRQPGLNHSLTKPISKRSYDYSPPKSKIVECSPPKRKELFEQEWPDSKKNQVQKSVCSKKKIVQTSLDIKREKRKNDKNKSMDKFHLSSIKQTEKTKTKSKDKVIEQKPERNNVIQKRKKFKKKTTPIQAGSGSSSIDTDPELTELRESSDEGEEKPDNSPDIDILKVENEDQNDIVEDEEGQDTTDLDKMDTPNFNNSNLTAYANKIVYQPTHNDFYNDPYRRSSESSISFTAPSPKLSPKKQTSLGTLDSYTVQNMLKRNQLLTRQKNDNHSYLHSYLKQMKLLKRSPPQNPRQRGIKHYSYSNHGRKSRRESQEIIKGNKLEKIAGYGRNNLPDDNWKPIPQPSSLGSTVDKGASRGSHYPVLPSYGKMKTNFKEKSDPTEIPWPQNIG